MQIMRIRTVPLHSFDQSDALVFTITSTNRRLMATQ